MTISDWSTTPASNNAAPPNGWPEGMVPPSINDAGRQMMADIRTWYGAFGFHKYVTATTLAAGTHNDYAPAGFSDATVLRISASGTVTLTGLSGGTDGRVIVLANTGSSVFLIESENVSSVAANRFSFYGANGFGLINMPLDGAAMFWYDGTSSRWRLIGRAN